MATLTFIGPASESVTSGTFNTEGGDYVIVNLDVYSNIDLSSAATVTTHPIEGRGLEVSDHQQRLPIIIDAQGIVAGGINLEAFVDGSSVDDRKGAAATLFQSWIDSAALLWLDWDPIPLVFSLGPVFALTGYSPGESGTDDKITYTLSFQEIQSAQTSTAPTTAQPKDPTRANSGKNGKAKGDGEAKTLNEDDNGSLLDLVRRAS